MTGQPSRYHSEASSAPPRRAKIACKACNARRVKCDAADGQPCWHCRSREVPCELLESRRGKYARKRRSTSSSQHLARNVPEVVAQSSQAPLRATRPEVVQNQSLPQISSGQQAVQEQQRFQSGVFGNSFGDSIELQSTDSGQDIDNHQNIHLHNPGQPTSLFYVVEVVHRLDDGSTETLDVRYSIPAFLASRFVSDERQRPMGLLSLQEALAMPPRDIRDPLIKVFFTITHPAYPVFDRTKFTQLYHSQEASPLVLHTMLLVAYTVGSDEVLQSVGCSDRASARKMHFMQAKTLYDADYDNDCMNTVACLLLLGFWWTGGDEPKDIYYWVGCATVLAQSLGMHRASCPGMYPQEKSLRKRIWWSIYIRDRQTAAAFGRPCHIRDEDCDVEPLILEDFEFDNIHDEQLILQEDFHVNYVLEMSRLAEILGDILISEYSPRSTESHRSDARVLAERLRKWESQLPDQLQRRPLEGSLDASFWASMLHFAYQNYYILLFRPKTILDSTPEGVERDARARAAADSIIRLAEDTLAAGMIDYGNVHVVPSLFGALAMQTIVICRTDRIQRQLAQNRSRQCLLALGELAKNWPVSMWIGKSFIDLMARLTDHVHEDSFVKVSSRIERANISNSRDQGHSGTYNGLFSTQCENSTLLHHPSAVTSTFDNVLWTNYFENTLGFDFISQNGPGLIASAPSTTPTIAEHGT